ncbi:unnamed protein product [Boreogadus saida]
MFVKGPALCLDFQRGAAFYTFQKGPALYLPFPRSSAIQTFQKGPSLYLAFVFADASTSPSSSPMPATYQPTKKRQRNPMSEEQKKRKGRLTDREARHE